MRSKNRLRALHPVSPKKDERGAMLLEALIGLLIFSMGILAMIGLQATAVRMNTGSKERADAAFLANQIISRMWTENRTTIGNYAHSAGGGGVLSFANRDRTDCTPNGVASTNGVVNSWLTTLGSFLPGATAARQQIVVTSTGATPDRVFTVVVGICWPADDGTWHNHVAQARVNES
jgi:type IV pilus assembly protein PilV